MFELETLNVLAVMHEQSKWTVTTDYLTASHSASGRMITDTDRMSFVYLLEAGDEYCYLHFDHKDWGALSLVSKEPAHVFVTDGEFTIELTHFFEELTSLLYSIEGNENYGHRFVEEVEKTFQQFYAQQN